MLSCAFAQTSQSLPPSVDAERCSHRYAAAIRCDLTVVVYVERLRVVYNMSSSTSNLLNETVFVVEVSCSMCLHVLSCRIVAA